MHEPGQVFTEGGTNWRSTNEHLNRHIHMYMYIDSSLSMVRICTCTCTYTCSVVGHGKRCCKKSASTYIYSRIGRLTNRVNMTTRLHCICSVTSPRVCPYFNSCSQLRQDGLSMVLKSLIPLPRSRVLLHSVCTCAQATLSYTQGERWHAP